jgi:hypothetical protein
VPYVFPNLGRFSPQNLGFMQAPAGAAALASSKTGMPIKSKR